MYESILIPTDGSEGTAHVAMHALDLAEQNDATVHALYVVEEDVSGIISRDDLRAELEEIGRQATGTIRRMAEARGLETVAEITDGDPSEEIVAYSAANGIDVVVMGTHGQSGLGRRLLGSVTERVVRSSSVPVLTMRLGETDVTVDSGEEAVSIAERAVAEAGYTDATVAGDAERQQSVWVVYAESGGDEFPVFVDPITQRAEILRH